MARRALSKNRIIPKNRKNTPNPVSPIPISVERVKAIPYTNIKIFKCILTVSICIQII